MERPGDEMARLAELFVGVWHGDDGLTPRHARALPSFSTWIVRTSVDGFCLLVDYEEQRGGQVTYRGHGVHGWDTRDGCLYAYWFDSVGVMPRHGNRATLDGARYSYQDARPGGLTRFTYDWSDGDLVFTIDRATDGAWAPMHVGRYRRT